MSTETVWGWRSLTFFGFYIFSNSELKGFDFAHASSTSLSKLLANSLEEILEDILFQERNNLLFIFGLRPKWLLTLYNDLSAGLPKLHLALLDEHFEHWKFCFGENTFSDVFLFGPTIFQNVCENVRAKLLKIPSRCRYDSVELFCLKKFLYFKYFPWCFMIWINYFRKRLWKIVGEIVKKPFKVSRLTLLNNFVFESSCTSTLSDFQRKICWLSEKLCLSNLQITCPDENVLDLVSLEKFFCKCFKAPIKNSSEFRGNLLRMVVKTAFNEFGRRYWWKLLLIKLTLKVFHTLTQNLLDFWREFSRCFVQIKFYVFTGSVSGWGSLNNFLLSISFQTLS